jgi:uncharacterized protein YjbI with pentapeptide repeats
VEQNRDFGMTIWKFSPLLLALLATPATAQKPPTVSPFDAPLNSCRAAAGALSSAGPAQGVDGTTLKNVSDIKSLRSKARDGRLIIIEGGDFTGQKFGSDNFSNICFRGTKLINTRWSKARAQGIGFINADLTGASFDRVWMDYVLFRNTAMARLDATGTRMTYGQLDGGWDPSMASLKLDNAQMQGFRFACGTTSADGCSFDRKQISLRGANLTGASVASFSLWDSSLEDARLDQTEISVDQITQFADAVVAGPVLVRLESRRVTLPADSFKTASRALGANKGQIDECTTSDTPLVQLLCQAGQSSLRAARNDIERLYQISIGQRRDVGGQIIVQAPNAIHLRYQKALKKCLLKGDEMAVPCLSTVMSKRRAMLVTQLVKAQPLESDGRAIYVSAQTPLADAVARDVKLAGLTPLLVDLSPHVLFAFRDDDEKLLARGVGLNSAGGRCQTSFAAAPAKASRKKLFGPTFAAWATGAEFTMGTPAQPRKKPRKPKKGEVVQPVVQASPSCRDMIYSGPLVRVPISEDDFDRLWLSQQARS